MSDFNIRCPICNGNIEINVYKNGDVLIRKDCLCDIDINDLIKCDIFPCILVRNNMVNNKNFYDCLAFEIKGCVWNIE